MPPKKQKKATLDNSITNFYTVLPKDLIPKYHNPCYENHRLNLPLRAIIVGASGAGKSQLALEILKRCQDTFGKVTIVCKNADEPLYKFLRSKLGSDELVIAEGIQNVPPLDDLEKDLQHLVIFDDLCNEKNQKSIEEYFIRGRKIAKGVSMLYLTQSFYKVPKLVRLQANYIMLKKLGSNRDLNLILSEYNLGVSKDVLLNIYKSATAQKGNLLMIDVDEVAENRFRFNFLQVIELPE